MAKIQNVPRVFKLGPTLLEDPDPTASPEDALALYRPNHPALAHCALAEPRLEGDRLVYEVQRPTATTKGRQTQDTGTDAAIEAEIAAWEAEHAGLRERLADAHIVSDAVRLLRSIARTRQDGANVARVDPAIVPMC